MSEELKPCPWCETPAHEQEWTKINGPWECIEVQCDGCERSVRGVDAIAAWNALPSTVQAAPSDRERLIEALDIIEQEAGDANKSRNDPWVILARIENIASAALSPEPWGGPEGEEE